MRSFWLLQTLVALGSAACLLSTGACSGKVAGGSTGGSNASGTDTCAASLCASCVGGESFGTLGLDPQGQCTCNCYPDFPPTTQTSSCQNCACGTPTASGGCADVCGGLGAVDAGTDGGAAAPDFCMGATATPPCATCIMNACGLPASACTF